MKITKVTYVSDYTLHVQFDDGTQGTIDLSGLVKKGIFTILGNKNLFSRVYTTGYSIAWSKAMEIDSLAVYSEISGKSIEELLIPKNAYASN